MSVRASQDVIASLSAVSLAYTHASQIVFASLATSTVGHARASQLAISVLAPNANPSLHPRVSQFTVAVLVWNHEVVMPPVFPTLPGLTFSVIKRPKFFTGIGTASTGREIRVAYAQYPLWEWDLTYNYLPDMQTDSSASASDFKTLIGFYLARSGAFQGFMFQDPDDNSVTGQVLGTTDGTTVGWTFVRTFGIGADNASEPIGWLNTDAPVHIYLDGTLCDPTSYTLVTTHGCQQQIRFLSPPSTGQALSATFGFYYSVRFKEDHYDFEKFMDKLWSQSMLTLMSQRD